MNGKGYEVEVLENYPSALNCVICSLIINKATHGCERHVFCEGCIKEYLTKSFEKECPICPGGCRKQIDPAKLSPNFTIDMMINKLKSKCSFKDCSWTGDLLDLVQDHRSQCNYATIKCLRNGCGESFLKEDTEKHDNICLYKYLQCCYCENDVLRMNKEDHEKSCAMEKVKCIYHEIGCNNIMCRRDVDKHEHDYQSVHMKLSFQNNIRNEKRLTQENINLKEKLHFVVEKSTEMSQLHNELTVVVKKSTEEINQSQQHNNELKEEVSKLNTELIQVKEYIKQTKFNERREKIKKTLTDSGYAKTCVAIYDKTLVIKTNNMFNNHLCVDFQQLRNLIKARYYDENHEKCFRNYNIFGAYFLEAFKVMPCHWFDFTGTGIVDKTQHVITFPIKDNRIEDFSCEYKTFTVQSIKNTMTVRGFPQENKIKIAIDGEERDVEVKEEFNPFDTDRLRGEKVSGSGCIIIQK